MLGRVASCSVLLLHPLKGLADLREVLREVLRPVRNLGSTVLAAENLPVGKPSAATSSLGSMATHAR